MTIHTIWVVPGIRGAGAAATAKRLWIGDEEERDDDPKPLDGAEIKATAEALANAVPGLTAIDAALDPDDPLVMLREAKDTGPDLEVNSGGLLIMLAGEGSTRHNEAEVERALAAAKVAIARWSGVLYDPQADRVLDPDRDAPSLLEAAKVSWAVEEPRPASLASLGMAAWLPLVGFVVAAVGIRIVGPVAFLAIPAFFVVAIVLAKRKKSEASAPPAAVASNDNRPIEP